MPKLTSLLARFFRQLPDPFHRLPEEWKQARLRREVKRRVREGSPGWKPKSKVFGIGLGRTGTMSLSYALRHLDYKSLHWKREGKILGWPEFFYADAATDTPCAAQFESLYHAFGGSKFIYTVRDVSSWKRSISNLYGVERPSELRSKEGRYTRWGFYNTIRRIQINESLYAQHDSWEEAYHAFDHRVRQFFDDKPDSRFLEMSITSGDGWEPLCSFLGHDVPDRPFPHRNRSEAN